MLENIQPPFGGCFLYHSYPSPNVVIPRLSKSQCRHPGVSGPAKLQNFVGDFGRDPVDALRQPVSFGIITQVLRSAKLDTAMRRYDDKTGPDTPV